MHIGSFVMPPPDVGLPSGKESPPLKGERRLSLFEGFTGGGLV